MQNNPETQEKIEQCGSKCLNAETLAKIYKYYKQKTNPYIKNYISFERIASLTFYKSNRKTFDKLFKIISKYKINHDSYIYFCIFDIQVKHPKDMLNVQYFVRYANKLKIENQYKKIYDNFLKTSNYIADVCISENITPKEYLKKLIVEKRLAIEYMCGNISTHFLAAINGIKNIFKYLDDNSKNELSIIYDATEKLNGDIQEAFMKFKSHRVSPLKFTEQMIKLKKIKQNKQ